ncbi:MAG: cupin domain-containing protein [Acidisphaera sp.]|nr:cupin domain-containing protein [Acidisphaera sp.]
MPDAAGEKMTAHTPFLQEEEKLGPLASRYVDVGTIPWKPTQIPGIHMKILLKDDSTGLMTALFRWAAGTRLPMHEHVDIEQSYILEGSIEDDEGEATAGNFVWRPRGNRHAVYSRHGALLLAMFQRPNVFLEEFAGEKLE